MCNSELLMDETPGLRDVNESTLEFPSVLVTQRDQKPDIKLINVVLVSQSFSNLFHFSFSSDKSCSSIFDCYTRGVFLYHYYIS